MMIKLFRVLFVWTVLAGTANARDVLARFDVIRPTPRQAEMLSKRFEIIRGGEERLTLLAPIAQTMEVVSIAPQAEMVSADDFLDHVGGPLDISGKIAGYHSFAEVQTWMRTLAANHPEIVSITSYGKSESGHDLLVMKISDNVAQDEDEPELMLTSATHGDELITVEVLMGIVDELVRDSGNNSRYQNMISGHEIFVIPVVNPEGFTRQSRYSNGVDPNRNFPWPGHENVSSVSCIARMIDFFKSRSFVGSIDFHAFGEMIMYPWAYTYESVRAPDQERMHRIGSAMGEQNNYTVGQISKVIYVAQGSSADFWYWQRGIISYGIEMARSKVPNAQNIPDVIDDNREQTWRFIESF